MIKIELPPRGLETLFGVHDQNIKYLESLLDVRIDARGQDVSIDGDPADVETAQRILEDFSDLIAVSASKMSAMPITLACTDIWSPRSPRG